MPNSKMKRHSKKVVHVAVGILRKPNGQILLTSRTEDKPWPFWWELPGGKIERNEAPIDAVARELKEELNVHIDRSHTQPWHTLPYQYPSGQVILDFFIVNRWQGKPAAMEGQILAWVQPNQLKDIGPILPATLPVLRWLTLPKMYLISQAHPQPNQWLQQLEQTLKFHQSKQRTCMVQFREPKWQQLATQDPTQNELLYQCLQQTLIICQKYHTSCLINSVHPQNWWSQAKGVQLRSSDAKKLPYLNSNDLMVQAYFNLPANHIIGISAHNLTELRKAEQLGADFAVLGHVEPTRSHPNEPPLGWPLFKQLCDKVALPVYAIGGQSPDTLNTALAYGAHGVAGISNFLVETTI